MRTKDRAYMTLAGLFPRHYREHIEKLLIYGGDKGNMETWLGTGHLLGILIFIGIVLVPWTLRGGFEGLYFLVGLIAYLLTEFAVYLVIYFKAEDRTKRVEEMLPDALQLISSNLKAGMTPYQSLKLATRKEFGPLAEEIEYATSQALGTEAFSDTLLRMSERIKSDVLDRALKLFTSAMKSGGHLAQMLKELAEDIAETKQLKNELVTNTKTYAAFILFTIIIGTPVLLAISVYFVDVVSGLQSSSGVGEVGYGLDVLAGELQITVDFLVKVSVSMLVITSILASMLLGVIAEGKEKQGLKFAVPMIIACLTVFFVSRYMITSLFGNFF